MSKIAIAGIDVRQDAEGRYSLNDLHRASGGENRHRPSLWAENQQTQALIAEVEAEAGIPALVSVKGGAASGTFVCKELVYAYAMWISPAFHLKVIRAYDQMVSHPAPPAELSRLEILQIAMESEQGRIRAEAERDEAIRTKAMIGSKREATAMAKASAAVRAADKLRHELGRNSQHATIISVQNVNGETYPRNAYVHLRRWCKQKGVAPVEVVDERYGQVKAWPAGAWLEVYGVDLNELFGGNVSVPRFQQGTLSLGGR